MGQQNRVPGQLVCALNSAIRNLYICTGYSVQGYVMYVRTYSVVSLPFSVVILYKYTTKELVNICPPMYIVLLCN